MPGGAAGGKGHVRPNGAQAGGLVQLVNLFGAPALTAADFMVI
jgi:hypothetical protein